MKFIEQKSISNSFAHELIQAAKIKAQQLNINVNIAIVDQGGNLLAFSRMDYAPLLSINIAQNKAYSAVAFRLPTHEWYGMIKDQPSLKMGIVHTEKLVVFGGGYPIYDGELLVGGIGVSGGSEDEDRQCCEAAMKLIKKEMFSKTI
ncbi:heme-binding protein [Bacillus sp. MM2020_1]|nr:heme-binding protein [Bacillus sp. MM2020_1]